jgi:hypothetical protein
MEKLKTATVKTFEVDPTPGNLSGLKTVIGVLLIAAAHSIDALNDVAIMLPDLTWIDTARAVLEMVTEYGEVVLQLIGSGFLSVGLLDKGRKFLKGILE